VADGAANVEIDDAPSAGIVKQNSALRTNAASGGRRLTFIQTC